MSCRTFQQIRDTVHARLDRCNSVNCSTALHRLAVLGEFSDSSDSSLFVALLLGRTRQILLDPIERKHLTPKTVSSIFWAIGKLFITQPQLIDTDLESALSSSVYHCLSSFDARGLAQIVWAIATLSLKDARQLLHSICNAAEPLLGRNAFKAQELAMFCRGLATVCADRNRSFLKILFKACYVLFRHFTDQGLSQIAWALAKFNFHDAKLIQALAGRVWFIHLDLQAIATISWSLSRLNFDNDDVFDKLASLVVQADFSSASAKTVGQILDAFSSTKHNEMMLRILIEKLSSSMISSMTASETIHILSCIVKAKAAPSKCLNSIILKAVSSLEDTDSSGLGTAAAALNRLSRLNSGKLPFPVVHLQAQARSRFRSAAKRHIQQLDWRAIGQIELLMRLTFDQESKWSRSVPSLAALMTSRIETLVDDVNRQSVHRNEQPGLCFAKAARSSSESFPSPGSTMLIMGSDLNCHLSDHCRHNSIRSVHWNRSIPSTGTSSWNDIGTKTFDGCIIRYPSSSEEFSMMLHLAAAKLTQGAYLWAISLSEEGILGVAASRAFQPLFTSPRILIDDNGVVILQATRSSALNRKLFIEDWIVTTDLQLCDALPLTNSWYTAPGLFAGGLVDVMTAAFMATLPTFKARSRVLDFGCGSGVISAALIARDPTLRITMTDSDAIAIDVARRNVPNASGVHLTDCWPVSSRRFDVILSNPPYHSGQPDNFAIVCRLIDEAPSRMKPGAALYIVAQEQIPIGRLIARSPASYISVTVMATPNVKFVMWSATISGKHPLYVAEGPMPKRRAVLSGGPRQAQGAAEDTIIEGGR